MGLSKGRDTVELSSVGQERDEELWNSLVQRVEGYSVGGKDLMSFPDWKERIPLPHKLNAISGFMYFYRADLSEEATEQQTLDLGETEVRLTFDALQFSKPCRVVHLFRPPEPSDYLKYTKSTAKMQLVRTKQRGVSAIKVPSSIRVFVELYDKLIEKVDGYVFEGKDLTEVPDWIAKMNVYHKREAVRELFGTTLQEEEL